MNSKEGGQTEEFLKATAVLAWEDFQDFKVDEIPGQLIRDKRVVSADGSAQVLVVYSCHWDLLS